MTANSMEGHRLRQPGEAAYLSEIGRTIWVFSILEWNAVWCCERLQPDCLPEISARTAGVVATRLRTLSRALPLSLERDELIADAEELVALVHQRNRLIHGRPCTSDGEARLSGGDFIWTAKRLQDAADAFSACSAKLNGHLHGWLSPLDKTKVP
jgi:hypothetical protein